MQRPSLSRFATVALSFGLLVSVGAPRAFADAAGAKKYVENARKLVDNDPEKAEVELKLADAELDGVPATDPVAKEVAALRTQIASAGDMKAKAELMRQLDYNMRESKEGIADKGSLKEYSGNVETLVNSDEGKKFLTEAQRADYIKQITAMRKAGAGMSLDKDVARIAQTLKNVEDKLPETLAAVKKSGPGIFEASNMSHDIEGLENDLKELPTDNPKVTPLLARLAKLTAAFNAEVGKGMTAEVAASLKRGWDIYENEWGGWEQEQGQPSWEEFRKTSSNEMSNLLLPKTANMVHRADSFLKNITDDEKYKQTSGQPEVKAIVDDVSKKRAAGVAKLVANIKKVLDEAEKDTLDKDKSQKLDNFVDQIRVMLDGDPAQEGLQARAKALVDKTNGAMAGAAKANEDLVKKMTEQAASAWPGMAAKFPANDASFDPSDALKNIDKYKGKTVRFDDTNNRLGWDYTGDYDFAVTRNGIPVVARFDPAVRAAVDDVEQKTKSGIGEYTWDVVAVVEGLGKVSRRESADVNDGGTRIATVEGHTTMDAPVLRIVAFHAGPFAAAAGVGAVTADGSIAPVGGAAGGASSGGGFLGIVGRLVTLVVGLTAAAFALMKANFAPVAGLPQAGQLQARIGSGNIAYIGVLFMALGLIWLIEGRIIYGLLTSLSVIAAGAYIALDLLVAWGVVKEPQAAKIRPLGVPIGLACAALVILSFVTGGALKVI